MKYFQAFIAGMVLPSIILPIFLYLAITQGKPQILTIPFLHLIPVIWGIRELYSQHTQDTGQEFLSDAVDHAYYLTAGQPWLVNALAYQTCYRDAKDPAQPITKKMIDGAKEALIKRRDTHIDSLRACSKSFK